MIFVHFASSNSGSMIILALLVERVIVVMKPLKAASLLSPKRALIITFILVVLLVIFNYPVIVIVTADSSGECIFVQESFFTSTFYNALSMFISAVLPLRIILIMNLIILCALKSSKQITKRPSKKRGSYKQRIAAVPQIIASKNLSTSEDTEMSH